MKNNLFPRILLAVTILLAFIVVVSLVFFGNKPSINESVKEPSPETALQVISVAPSGENLNQLSIVAPVNVTFNQNIIPKYFIYETDPKILLNIKINDNQATLSPDTNWPMGKEVKITIVSAKSTVGYSLKTPYSLTIKSPIPKGDL